MTELLPPAGRRGFLPRLARRLAFAAALLLLPSLPAAAAETLDATPRTAVVSAYQPEWQALQAGLEGRQEHVVNGTVFLTGWIEGKPVLLFLSGVSMVNAAMTTQLALDRFAVDRIVFSGIAGGVDPALKIGDVVVPEAWSQYLEAVFARETPAGWSLPPFADRAVPNYGMIFPQSVEIADGWAKPEARLWFPVDPGLLAVARAAAEATELARCKTPDQCLGHAPRIVVGGKGVSGQAFVDNKAFREYVFTTFGAGVLDMESAAVAHVAYANRTPFIAIRSLSDLAGGGDGENEIGTFFKLASDNSALLVKAILKGLP